VADIDFNMDATQTKIVTSISWHKLKRICFAVMPYGDVVSPLLTNNMEVGHDMEYDIDYHSSRSCGQRAIAFAPLIEIMRYTILAETFVADGRDGGTLEHTNAREEIM